ncbi:putative two-component system response regulator [Nocardiopsis sp. JB363]|nr:putative two-component system response regulator [Nocardiopsis sp. JB363]
MEPDIEVVADVCTGDDVLPVALEHRPDVAVLDVQMPGMDGTDAAARILGRVPACRTLILTRLARPEVLRRALTAGASGFMLKDAPPAELAQAIRRVAAGERVVDPEARGAVRNYLGTVVTKLDARNRLDAVRIATEAGWL